MRFLLTNDDGYDAPGLRALHEAVGSLPGVEIGIIAPAVAQSGTSHSTSESFICRQVCLEGMGQITVAEGTPADCVRAALHLPGHPRPDWVIAGINRGSNLGVDIFYSGTVAAAREAAILGVPAIAISQLVKPSMPDDWLSSARLAAAIMAAITLPEQPPSPWVDQKCFDMVRRALLDAALSAAALSPSHPVAPVRPMTGFPSQGCPAAPCWNVNLPRSSDGRPPLGACVAPISSDPPAFGLTPMSQGNGITRLTYVGRYHERQATPGTDVALAFAGYITLSPLALV
ncbi:MAG TPA: 5'/3'-nucleotidase SurE [Phycisphaerae bacterium]|nr:5'/3'-nucleotidase SurE [Phycisphaerae bacterium]HRR85658.1 5'/3'-nucleotidase SurE [Phycisphaerae bacterium]